MHSCHRYPVFTGNPEQILRQFLVTALYRRKVNVDIINSHLKNMILCCKDTGFTVYLFAEWDDIPVLLRHMNEKLRIDKILIPVFQS